MSIQCKEFLERVLAEIPLAVGALEDIAGLACFLCMRSAGYMTGQTLIVDGGLAEQEISSFWLIEDQGFVLLWI